MSEIKFKLVDGEPVCLLECPFNVYKYGKTMCHACATHLVYVLADVSTCIPGLRQQRDIARAKRDHFVAELAGLCQRDGWRKKKDDQGAQWESEIERILKERWELGEIFSQSSTRKDRNEKFYSA